MLRAASKAFSPIEGAWESIESAPKDGRLVRTNGDNRDFAHMRWIDGSWETVLGGHERYVPTSWHPGWLKIDNP